MSAQRHNAALSVRTTGKGDTLFNRCDARSAKKSSFLGETRCNPTYWARLVAPHRNNTPADAQQIARPPLRPFGSG